MDIADFIRARLDEQEKRVWHMRKQVIERLWCAYPSGASWRIGMANGQEGYVIARGMEQSVAEYIQALARPNQVLAELEAKRGMIRLAFQHAAKIDGEWGCCHSAEQIEAGECEYEPLPDLLRLLALPYAAHPDYRPEWAPEDEE